MRPVRVTIDSVAASAPIPLDIHQDPFNVSLGVVLSGGASLTYSVEHTFDDVFAAGFTPASATWFANSGLGAQTTSRDGNYAFPVTAVRLNVTARVGGSATMTVIQAGTPGS